MALHKATLAPDPGPIPAPDRPTDVAGWTVALQDASAALRAEAAVALAGWPEAADVLATRLLDETDERVRQALFTALARRGDEAAAKALLPLLRSEDARLRNGAIEALASMPQAVAPQITALLHDGDADVRIFTVNLLGELRHPQVVHWLLQVVADDASINAVAAAIEVLAEAGAPEHLPALRAARQRFAGDAFIGFAVDMAIDRIEAK